MRASDEVLSPCEESSVVTFRGMIDPNSITLH